MTDLPALVCRACLAERTARKPGNVHPGADFDDLTHEHFVTAAHVAAETLPRAAVDGIGPAVLDCVRETVRVCGTNVNLGIALLLAPLCAVPRGVRLADGVRAVVDGTTVADAAAVYEAIRLAAPGGLGDAGAQDVRGRPTVPLSAAMAMAAGRDDVARQYATGFADVAAAAGRLAGRVTPAAWEWPVLDLFLGLLSGRPDTHIARRCGVAVAEDVRRRAAAMWQPIGPGDGPPDPAEPAVLDRNAFQAFDRFLRTGSPRKNPGTTADLTCAALFWAARENLITLPDEAELAACAARFGGPRVSPGV